MKITAHYDCGCTWLDCLGAFLKTVDKSRRKPVETVKSLMVRRTGTKKEAQKDWKRTATKKQFESAKKAQEKAHDANEKGVRKLMARTDPVGYDRFHNRVYYFHHDPEVLYIKMIRIPTGLATHLPNDLQINRTSFKTLVMTMTINAQCMSM